MIVIGILLLYEQVRHQLKMDNGFLKYFLSNMGSSKSALSHFGLCIDKLEEIVNKVAKKGLGDPRLMHELIFKLICVNGVILWSYNLDDVQHSFNVLDMFCEISSYLEKIQNVFLHRQFGAKSSTYPIMLL